MVWLKALVAKVAVRKLKALWQQYRSGQWVLVLGGKKVDKDRLRAFVVEEMAKRNQD